MVNRPREVTASWGSIESALYHRAVILHVLQVRKVTIYGFGNGKAGKNWQSE